VKYLVVRRASWYEYLLARQPDLVVLGKRTVLSVEPCRLIKIHNFSRTTHRIYAWQVVDHVRGPGVAEAVEARLDGGGEDVLDAAHGEHAEGRVCQRVGGEGAGSREHGEQDVVALRERRHVCEAEREGEVGAGAGHVRRHEDVVVDVPHVAL
jgi:hypothetical protein